MSSASLTLLTIRCTRALEQATGCAIRLEMIDLLLARRFKRQAVGIHLLTGQATAYALFWFDPVTEDGGAVRVKDVYPGAVWPLRCSPLVSIGWRGEGHTA